MESPSGQQLKNSLKLTYFVDRIQEKQNGGHRFPVVCKFHQVLQS